MMKYISLDIETTGRNPQRHDILEIGAVIDDFDCQATLLELPKFHCYVVKDEYVGEPAAFAMNHEILKRISEHDESKYNFYQPHEVVAVFEEWVRVNQVKELITFAGKNFASFDLQFLLKLPGWKEHIKHHRRSIDLGSIFFQPKIHRYELPSLADCMKAAGFNGHVMHTAVEDALVVVQLLRKRFCDEYKSI